MRHTTARHRCAPACALIALMAAGTAFGRSTSPPHSALQAAGPLERVMVQELEPISPELLLAEDAAVLGPGPFRFASPTDVTITPATHGTWERLADGGRLWRLRIWAPHATDLNLGFTRFRLPEGATLHLISEDHDYFQGPYGAADVRDHGELWTPVVPGERSVVELYVPPDPAFEPELVLGRIGRGYRDLFAKSRDLAKQGSCNIDVVCGAADGYPWVDDWRAEIQSVAVYSVGGQWACSGTMVSDAAHSLQPYFLTAYHCGVTSANDQSVVTYWNFQSPTCGQLGGGTLNQSLSGATLLARRQDVDVCLLELEDSPPPSFRVYWAGWDRRTDHTPRGSVAIHHPNTDEKAISLNDDPLTLMANCIFAGPSDTHWRVNNWEFGTTEQGSSGSGLWDTDTHLLVGYESGGSASCGFPQGYDCFGRIAVAWDGDTSDQRLRDWLDPSGIGVETVVGKFASGAGGYFSCGNAGYDLNVAESAAWFNGGRAGDPDYMFAVRFALADFGYAPGEVEIAGFCASNQIPFTGGPWPNEVFIYPDAGGAPDDSQALGQGTIETGDGTGDAIVMLDQPVTLNGDFWLVNRGDPKHAGEDFNMEFDAGPNTGNSWVSNSGIGGLSTETAPEGGADTVNYMLRAYLQPVGTGPAYTYLVAGVARNAGVGANYRTKLALLNRSGTAATVTVSFVRDSSTVSRTVELAAGEQRIWDNVVEELFGITDNTAGAGKVESNRPLVVTARTYNLTAEGTYGQFLPGVTSTDTFPTGSTRAISQLVNNAAFRSNVGFVSLSAKSCEARVRLYDASGAAIGSPVTLTVPALGWVQRNNIFAAAGAGQRDNAYATVEVLTPGCLLWGYGSIGDNDTGDPTTVPMSQ